MASLQPRFLLLLLLTLNCILMISRTYCSDDRKTYIVYMGDRPKDMDSTSIPSLHMNMARKVLGSEFKQEHILHSYKRSFNGFVVMLTEEEAEIMAEMDDVVSIFPNKKKKFHTTRSWEFLGVTQQVKRTRAESDIIVGVLDSGIMPESESFSDKGFGPPPKKWKGACQNFVCNNKIIGARYYRLNGTYPKNEFISAIDVVGHGTHCASVAAGNLVSSASLQGLKSGTARGGVPSARIAVYKIGWTDGVGSEAEILAGFDDAIADGVDIISISVGDVTPLKYFEDSNAIGAFHAMQKGILTSNSAGNDGPLLSTMATLAPWLLSVAASTIDRKLSTKIQLGNGRVFEGSSINTFDLKNKKYPLIYAPDATNISGGFHEIKSRLCYQNSLDKKLVKGKIVLCDDYFPYDVGIPSGAVGIIFTSLDEKDRSDAFVVPATHISLQDGSLLLKYMNSTSNPTATIDKSNEGKDSAAPYIPSFSSRGPNPFSPNILKPDLAAPGFEILAAWSPFAPVSDFEGDKRVTKYNIISGTSMACPHVSAAAAYVKSFYPNWSPSRIKSALMTTATPMSADLNPEAEFAYGAGQLNPIKAVNPGLVYDASEADYIKFLCREGYDTKKLRILTKDKSTCTGVDKESVWDLNLPSFALFTNGSVVVNHIFHRTVTNVGSATSTYKAIVRSPSYINIQVHPSVLSFKSKGEKKSFSVSIEGLLNVKQLSASLVWDDGTFQVRSPIVVYGY